MQAIKPYTLAAYSPRVRFQVEETKNADSPFLPMTLLYRAAIIAAYAVILLTIVLNVEVSNKSPVFVFLCLALVLNFSIVLLPVVFYRPPYGWFHPLVFDCCLYLLFQVRSFATYLSGLSSHRALPTWSPEEIVMLIVYALALHSLATASYYFGFFCGPDFSVPRLSFASPRQVPVKATVVVIFSLVTFYLYIQARGGLQGHLLSWQGGRHDSMAGEGYWHLLIKFAEVATLLWFAMDRRALYRPLFWACCAVSIYINFMATGSRSLAVFALIGGLFIWMLREKRISLVRIIGLGVIVLIMIGFLGSFRREIWKGTTRISATTENTTLAENFAEGAVESGGRAWSGSGLLPIIALVPDQIDLLYGSSYVSVLTIPIPRSFWKDKPGQIGGLTGETFFGSQAGIPPGAIGEAYWNFHVPGVIIIFFLFGTFHKWLAEFYLKYSGRPAIILIYLTVLFLFDPTTPAVVSGMLLLIPMLVLLRLMGAIRLD